MTIPWQLVIPLATAAIVGLGEVVHARRTRRLAHLAFGETGRARTWVVAVPFLRPRPARCSRGASSRCS